jgi:hypothetical protein
VDSGLRPLLSEIKWGTYSMFTFMAENARFREPKAVSILSKAKDQAA